MGEHIMEPLLFQRPVLSPAAQAQLDNICQKFNIPPLDECQTYQQYVGEQKPSVSERVQHWIEAVRNSVPDRIPPVILPTMRTDLIPAFA